MASSAELRERTKVTVVGGGIAGLYATYLLANAPDIDVDIELLDLTADRLGGKITTRRLDVGGQTFLAEFGPMRFELDIQERFRRLCQSFEIQFKDFSQTASPRIITRYEMSDVEKSFESVADLHEWAVLRMFFESEEGHWVPDLPGSEDIASALQEIERENYAAHRSATEVGKDQLAWLQCYMDRRLFLERDRRGKLVPLSCADMEEQLNRLRHTQRLHGDLSGPLLRDIGLWHALSEVITPGALAKIRDSGTFYHCVVNNPSAVEWGIFWLRQASSLGHLWTFDEADNGVSTIVDRLVVRLRSYGPRVLIRKSQEVVQVEPAKRNSEVVVRCLDRTDETVPPYNLRTDHLVLALPKSRLERLSEHFPDEVSHRVDGVETLSLLKAFVVTKDAWWDPGLQAQSYAWVMPTRELHFYPQEPVGASTGKQHPGMIMLYTDQPGIYYWDVLIPRDERDAVLWRTIDDGTSWDPVKEVEDHPFGLLDLLVRRLLVVPHPGLSYTINEAFADKAKELKAKLEKAGNMAEAKVVGELVRDLQPKQGHVLGISQRIVERWPTLEPETQWAIEAVLHEVAQPLPERWRSYLEQALEIRKDGINAKLSARKAKDVLAYGIRDWSGTPFGGAAHLWTLAHSYLPVDETGDPARDVLLAFALRERVGGPNNVHICGEAYSGNQGFIEGALQTAERVVAEIVGEDRLKEALTAISPDALSERTFLRQRSHRINKAWDERYDKLYVTPSGKTITSTI